MRHALIVALLLGIIACAPAQTDTPPIAPPVDDQPPVAPPVDDQPTVETTPPVVDDREVNEEIAALLAKGKSVKSIVFVAGTLTKERGDLQAIDLGTYSLVGMKAKVSPRDLVSMDGWTADYVFVDFETEKAFGYCLELAPCRNLKKREGTSFEAFDIPLPLSWADRVQYGEKIRDGTYDSRPIVVVRWQEEDGYYESFVDKFFGIPLRVIRTSDAERADILEGYEYRGVAINSIKAADVEPPY